MSAAASLTIPASIVTTVQAYDAQQVLTSAPGTSNISVDAGAGKLSFKFEFPGNIDRIMEKLRARHVTNAQTLAVSIPVENLTGRTIEAAEFVAHISHSPVVHTAAYDGKTLTATIAAQTNAMRYLYEEIIIWGLMPLDVPTVAHPQDFVL
jgi:hypothetical protein